MSEWVMHVFRRRTGDRITIAVGSLGALVRAAMALDFYTLTYSIIYMRLQ